MLKNLLMLAALMGGVFVFAQDLDDCPNPVDPAQSEAMEEACDSYDVAEEQSTLLPWPVDLELGETWVLNGGQYPYVLSRVNIAFGPEILGSRLWLLPELGVFFKGETSFWLRGQLLLDGPTNTLFIEGQTSPLLGTLARAGIRFGF